MPGKKPKFDPKHTEHDRGERASGHQKMAATSGGALPKGGQPEAAPYRDDPRFRSLVEKFQNGEWGACLDYIGQLLEAYPNNAALLTFKQDVEMRSALEQNSARQRAEESKMQRRKRRIRALGWGAAAIVVVALSVWGGSAYQAGVTRARQAQEATLTAEALASQRETANTLMKAGKPQEALTLYDQIRAIDPVYEGIDQDIAAAQQAIAVEDLYQQGKQYLDDGNRDKALESFKKVEQLQPEYKDTAQLIDDIEKKQQIDALIADIHSAYAQNDWESVIKSYDAIQILEPFTDIPDLKDELFVSYEERIRQIAASSNPSLTDIQSAADYYRRAMALFPQSSQYATQRQELEAISADLLGTRYYLEGMGLLESANYSISGLQDSIRALQKVNSSLAQVPAVKAGIEKAQTFLDAYNSLLGRKWDAAIKDLQTLYTRDPGYAGGRARYFLYEAYTARGDLLLVNADFGDALKDYQSAERLAYGDGSSLNLLRLFQIQVRTATVLRKLGRDDEAAEYYHYAYESLPYRSWLTEPAQKDLLDLLTQADAAFKAGKKLEATKMYESVGPAVDQLYVETTVAAHQGDTLPNLAFENNSSLSSLMDANKLGEDLVLSDDVSLQVPVFPTTGN